MIYSLSFVIVAFLSVFVVSPVESSLSLSSSSLQGPYHVARPIEGNYTATGTTYVLNNMTIYETIDKTPNRVLIMGYDAMGLRDNLKQVADKLAEGFGFKIVIPDFFRGHEWNEDTWPPEDPAEGDIWFDLYANWNNTVQTDVLAVLNHYRTTENVTDFGVFGFCWGGYFSTHAAMYIPDQIKAAAIVHPTYVYNEEAEHVQVPMYLMPSNYEINMLPFYMVLQRKFGSNSGHRRFDDMAHAFAGFGGNFSDPLIQLRVNEVIDIMGKFFDRNLV